MDLDTMDTSEKLEVHKLQIIKWPDDRLRRVCDEITGFDSENNRFLEQLFLDMSATLITEQGLALAAPQVAVMSRFVVMLVDNQQGGHTPFPLVNPNIIESSDKMFEWEEGCLSVPGYFEKRSRPERIVAMFQTLTGEQKEAEFRGIYAFALQHEIDHLNGKCFVDGLSWIKTQFIKKKIKKSLKRG